MSMLLLVGFSSYSTIFVMARMFLMSSMISCSAFRLIPVCPLGWLLSWLVFRWDSLSCVGSFVCRLEVCCRGRPPVLRPVGLARRLVGYFFHCFVLDCLLPVLFLSISLLVLFPYLL